METYFKTLETTMAAVMAQTVKASVSTELARFQAAVQGARVGPIQPQIDQAGYIFEQVQGGKVTVSIQPNTTIAQKLTLARINLNN